MLPQPARTRYFDKLLCAGGGRKLAERCSDRTAQYLFFCAARLEKRFFQHANSHPRAGANRPPLALYRTARSRQFNANPQNGEKPNLMSGVHSPSTCFPDTRIKERVPMGDILMLLICAVYLAPPLISMGSDRDIALTLSGNIVSFPVAYGLLSAANWLSDHDMKWAFWVVVILMPIIHLALWTTFSKTFGTNFLHLLRLGPPPQKKKWKPGRRR